MWVRPEMHELALARSLINLVDDYAAQNGHRRVRRVHVRLGQMSAMTRALYFCFGSASRGTSCEGAELDIEEIPLTVNCRHCDGVKTPSGRYNFRCPDCGMPTPEVVTGREMQLAAIELDRDCEAMDRVAGNDVPVSATSQSESQGEHHVD
jgi:hydrogenase nickel incorporation protein HypA/HybF